MDTEYEYQVMKFSFNFSWMFLGCDVFLNLPKDSGINCAECELIILPTL
jgi:hypothetical protein